jgi:alkylhydroperoxidase family enzyme
MALTLPSTGHNPSVLDGRAVALAVRPSACYAPGMAMHVEIPEGKDPIEYVWGEMVPGIGPAAAKLSLAVYAHTTLSLREFEAARLRIAQINGCAFCLSWRTERDGQTVEEEFADAVAEWRTSEALDERARLAAEYAERYALDHHGLDDEFWERMSTAYTQREIVELSMSIGSWLAFGRLNHVLGLDTMCVLP